MSQFDDTDITIASTGTATPHYIGSSKSPGRSYSDVRERFARRQQRKLEEERLHNATQTLHLPNELTRSSAFMSPIIQATLKRGRESSHQASALISPTSVTHAIPREPHVVVVGSNSIKDENQEADKVVIDDQKIVSRYPMLCSANVRNRDAPSRLQGLQGRGSLLDSAIFITSCGRHRREEDALIRNSEQTSQYLSTAKSNISEDRALRKTSQFLCRTDANTKKFAYQTFVEAGLLLGRTVTDCTVLSKDVYRLNSTATHRQRDDDLNFFLHESGDFEVDALNDTLRPSEPLIRSRTHAKPIGIDYSEVFQHTSSRTGKDFRATTDSSNFSQLLHRAYTNDQPFLPRETKSKRGLDTFRSQYNDIPSGHMDPDKKASSRAVTESHQGEEVFIPGLEIKLKPRTTTGALRLPSKPKLHDDFDLHLDARRWRLDDHSDYKNHLPENILYVLPQVEVETDRPTNDLQACSEEAPTIPDESKVVIDDDEIIRSTEWDFAAEGYRRGNNNHAAKVPMELASLRGEIAKLRAQIAEARIARFVAETDKGEAMLDRDRTFTEVRELKTWVSKVEQQEREIRCQIDSEAQARDMEANKLRRELDKVRSLLEPKELLEKELYR